MRYRIAREIYAHMPRPRPIPASRARAIHIRYRRVPSSREAEAFPDAFERREYLGGHAGFAGGGHIALVVVEEECVRELHAEGLCAKSICPRIRFGHPDAARISERLEVA